MKHFSDTLYRIATLLVFSYAILEREKSAYWFLFMIVLNALSTIRIPKPKHIEVSVNQRETEDGRSS
jgi:hypothetical protein